MNIRRRTLLGTAALPGAAAGAPATALAKRLDSQIDRIRLYDSHEHLIPEKTRLEQPADFFELASHYAMSDVISAGLAGDSLKTVRDPKASLDRRWAAFEPSWDAARHTGYGQALSIAVRDLYGGLEISRSNIARIDGAVREGNRPGLYTRVLREKAGIDWCLVDAYWAEKPARPDRDDFLLAQKFDGFVTPGSPKDLERLETISGVAIHSLADLRKALEATFQQAIRAGMITVKSTLAYQRTLRFEEVEEADAARDFDALTTGVTAPAGFRKSLQRPLRRLEDYMFHQVVRLADAHRYPFQIHTGLLAGNSLFLENLNPRLLANLFHLYPNVRFDLFHIGYPYQEELGVLVKLFPNVYVDFCWAHIISPTAARRTLDDYLETVPSNKILAFGGDYRFPELTYAHAHIARRNVAKVLTGKVEAGLFDEERAMALANKLLHGNAMALFPPAKGRVSNQ